MNKLTLLLILIFIYLSPPLIAQDINNGRVAFYPFNGSATDAVGTNHGTNNGATLTPDRFGNVNSAYNFDGIDDYIEISHNDVLNFGVDDNFSISFWIKITTQANVSGNNDIISKWIAHPSTGYPYAIRYYDDNGAKEQFHKKILCIRYDTDAAGCDHAPRVQSPCALPMEQWIHIVFRKTGEELTMFKNGMLVSTEVDATTISCGGTKNVSSIYFGMRGGYSRHFKGVIDDVSFYNRSITNEEVNLLFEENGWTAPINTEKDTDILSFKLPKQTTPTIINKTNHSIDVTVECQANLSELIASFTLSDGATAEVNGVNQTSGTTINDFSEAVIYKVISQNTCYQQNWTINVHREEFDQNEIDLRTAIKTFSFPEQIGTAIIEETNHSIDVTVECQASLSELIASFTLSDGASADVNGVNQTSGTTINDFSEAVIYKVISQNTCYQQNWTINVHREELDQNEIDLRTAIKTFSFSEQIGTAIIDETNHSIDVTVECQASLSELVASFTLSDGATAEVNGANQTSGTTKQVSGASVNNFEQPVVYEVNNRDGCAVQQWTVSVSLEQTHLNTILGDIIPNVITPNYDKKNDTWKIVSDTETYTTHVKIFNRWGSLVFEDDDYKNNWGGETLRSGVYFYTITSKCSTSDQYKGWLHVIK